MKYYPMRVYRSSFIDVLVKADSAQEAKADVNIWLSSTDDEEVFRDLTDDRAQYSIKYDGPGFDTIEEYNRSPITADFEIDMHPNKNQTEPRYDLHLNLYADKNNKTSPNYKCWPSLTMESVLNILQEYNKQYILTNKFPDYDMTSQAAANNCKAFYYECVKRED